jgi:hypothetical protein
MQYIYAFNDLFKFLSLELSPSLENKKITFAIFPTGVREKKNRGLATSSRGRHWAPAGKIPPDRRGDLAETLYDVRCHTKCLLDGLIY